MSKIVIGLSGKPQSGKDTIGDYFVEKHSFTRIAFADAVKDVARILFGFTDAQLYGADKLKVVPSLGKTPAYYLQLIGTEAIRNVIGSDIWVDIVLRKMKHADKRVVITDVRFPNEAFRLKDMGATLVRVERDGVLRGDGGRNMQHSAETSLDDYLGWNHVVFNNGTKDELYSRANLILESVGISTKLENQKDLFKDAT